MPSPPREPTLHLLQPSHRRRANFMSISPGTFSRAVSHSSLFRLGLSVYRSGGFPSIYVSSLHDSNIPLGFLLHLRWDFTARAHPKPCIINFTVPK